MKFVLICCLLFAACSPPHPSLMTEVWAQPNGKVKVLSTTAMIDDIVGRIGKDRIDHIALINGEIDPHNYELVKGDDEKFSIAQAIFYTGLGLEHGASLRYQLEHHANGIDLGSQIQADLLIDVGGQVDPHVWMDISLWSQIVQPIVMALSKIDPAGSEYYEKNGQEMREAMLAEHQRISNDMKNVPTIRRYLVTSHDAFNYFTRAYLATVDEVKNGTWRERVNAPEGLAPEGQLSTADIQKTIDYLLKHQVKVVFPESNVSRDSLKKVINACAKKGLVVTISKDDLYADAMGKAGSYLKMVQYDANVLIEAWK